MNVHLHILNASGRLTPLVTRIRDTFRSSIAKIGTLIPISDIDVVVMPGKKVIPETGLTGFAPKRNTLHITIDSDNENLLDSFDQEFLATLGHEMHHCLRWGKPGYGRTLSEALVSEGLACCFETELRGGNAPFYATFVPPGDIEALLKRAEPELDALTYDHPSWFFGSEERNIPRYAGYSLGYHVTSRHLARANSRASALWDIPAGAIPIEY